MSAVAVSLTSLSNLEGLWYTAGSFSEPFLILLGMTSSGPSVVPRQAVW